MATPPPPNAAGHPKLDIAAGASVGTLLGFLVGMSVSPIVAPVATGLVAVLLGLLGLRAEKEKVDAAETEAHAKSETSKGGRGAAASAITRPATSADSRRVVGFGVGCTAAVVIGLLARTHDWLGPDLEHRLAKHKKAWLAVGYGEDQARDLAAWSAGGAFQAAAQDAFKSSAGWMAPQFGSRLANHLDAWKNAGFDVPRARELAAWSATDACVTEARENEHQASKNEKTGGREDGPGQATKNEEGKPEAPAGAAPPRPADAPHKPELFADTKRLSECQEIRRYPLQDGTAALERFKAVGGVWAAFAEDASRKDAKDRLPFLQGAVNARCDHN